MHHIIFPDANNTPPSEGMWPPIRVHMYQSVYAPVTALCVGVSSENIGKPGPRGGSGKYMWLSNFPNGTMLGALKNGILI